MAPTKKNLPRKLQGERLGAAHMNIISETVEMVNREITPASRRPFEQRRVRIIASGCDGVFDADNDGFDEIFTIQPMYWAGDGVGWALDDEGAQWCLDGGSIIENDPKVGDEFIAYYDPQRAAFLPIATKSASGAQIISFAIVSSDPTNRSALVEIRQRTFSGTVYGSTLEDSVVTVYDTDGCYLNEPNVDLTGRLGKAVLMFVDAEAEALHFPGYFVPEKYWNVLSLCCPSMVCE